MIYGIDKNPSSNIAKNIFNEKNYKLIKDYNNGIYDLDDNFLENNKLCLVNKTNSNQNNKNKLIDINEGINYILLRNIFINYCYRENILNKIYNLSKTITNVKLKEVNEKNNATVFLIYIKSKKEINQIKFKLNLLDIPYKIELIYNDGFAPIKKLTKKSIEVKKDEIEKINEPIFINGYGLV